MLRMSNAIAPIETARTLWRAAGHSMTDGSTCASPQRSFQGIASASPARRNQSATFRRGMLSHVRGAPLWRQHASCRPRGRWPPARHSRRGHTSQARPFAFPYDIVRSGESKLPSRKGMKRLRY
jgi:hypothetical protein